MKDRIATITLNRPDRLNAYTDRMAAGIRLAMAEAAGDKAVRVIVLTGAGRGFCAGADMDLLQGIQQAGEERQAPRADDDVGDAFDSVYGPSLDAEFARPAPLCPISCAPRNRSSPRSTAPCAGIGLIMTLYADLRFVSDKAVLTTSFAQRGLIAEHGISWLLPRLIGPAHALDILLSARKFSPQEAKEMGLVNKVFAADTFMDNVTAYARILADTVSPRSMAVMKAQVWKSYFQKFGEALETADAEMPPSFKWPDFKEGVDHFLQKRAPRFADI
ncbi:MAG: enoyl-CoA hydratase-related protein [Rhizomicrobium sp.]